MSFILAEISFMSLEPNEENFILLMNYNNGDTEIANAICKYIDVCLKLRAEVTKREPCGLYSVTKNIKTVSEFLRLSRISI
jgi:hypothetical protein